MSRTCAARLDAHRSGIRDCLRHQRVLERTTQQPLPNADRIDLDRGARRFTNAEGSARLAWGPTGRLRLRQLGFQCVCRTSRIGRRTAGAALLTAYWSCLPQHCHPEERQPLSSRGATATRDLARVTRGLTTSSAHEIPRRGCAAPRDDNHLLGMTRQYSGLATAPWVLPPEHCDCRLLPDD